MVRRTVAILCAAALAAGCTALLGVDGDYGDLPAGTSDAAGGGDATTAADGAVNAKDAGAAGDSSMASDARSDAAADSGDGGCAGHLCNGECRAGASCADCAGATMLCVANNVCVPSCGTCPGSPVECFHCTGTTVSKAECYPRASATCLAGGGTYTDHCPCDGGAVSLCPGATQVCSGGLCLTCGEDTTDSLTCKGVLKQCDIAQGCHN